MASATPFGGVVLLLAVAVLVGAFSIWSEGRHAQVEAALEAQELAQEVDRWLSDAALLRNGVESPLARGPRANAALAKGSESIARLRRSELGAPGLSLSRDPLLSAAAEVDALLLRALEQPQSQAGAFALQRLREASARWLTVASDDLRAARVRADAAGARLKITLIGLVGAALILALALGHDFYRHNRESAAERVRARERTESLRRDLASSRLELERVNERLELALAAARIVVFTQDKDLRFEWVSRGDFGLPPEDFEGRSDEEILGAEAARAMREAKQSALATHKVARCEIGLIDRGAPRRIELHVRPIASSDGGAGLLGAMIDVTERHLDRESNRWLMGELSHRTQNLLAIVQSMARHTARGSQDVRAFLARFCDRLAALSACHHLLVRSSFRGVDMADLVTSQLLGAQALVGSRVRLDGPALIVRPDAAQTLAMTISELAANALAFGALSGGEGTVDISWTADKEPQGQVRIVWRETSAPEAEQQEAPRRRGFGAVVIEQMTPRALGAHVVQESLPDGWRCEIVVPLRRLTAIEEAPSEAGREPVDAHDVGPA